RVINRCVAIQTARIARTIAVSAAARLRTAKRADSAINASPSDATITPRLPLPILIGAVLTLCGLFGTASISNDSGICQCDLANAAPAIAGTSAALLGGNV